MAHGLTTAGGAVRITVRFQSGGTAGPDGVREPRPRLEHADERDLIETFVERSRWHCRAARETFSSDEFRPVTTVLASTSVTEYWAAAGGSLRLDVCRPDHLAPKLGFRGDELSELDRAHRHRHMAYLSHPRLDLGFDEAGVDLTIERLDDLGRRTTRRDNTNP